MVKESGENECRIEREREREREVCGCVNCIYFIEEGLTVAVNNNMQLLSKL